MYSDKMQKTVKYPAILSLISPSSCSLRAEVESFSLGRVYYSNMPLYHFLNNSLLSGFEVLRYHPVSLSDFSGRANIVICIPEAR